MKNYKTIIFTNIEQEDYIESLKHSFNNCKVCTIPFNITPLEMEELAKDINKQYNQVIFFDYYYNNYLLLPLLSKKIKKKWILKTTIPSLSNIDIYNSFLQIIEYKERGLIDNISTLDYNMYLITKEKYNFSYLQLDINLKSKVESENTIGLLGYDYLEENNIYNELSAITLTKYKKVNLLNKMNVTKQFGKDFNLEMQVIPNIFDLIAKNKINLYINFYDTNILRFLYSMDNGIPCILGNTELLNNNETLKSLLVLKSDDDINEIAKKIEQVLDNKKIIFNEYNNWRKNYTNESKKLVEEFLEK